MEKDIQELKAKLTSYNFNDQEKAILKDYLTKSIEKYHLEDQDLDPHWEDLAYTLKGNLNDFFNEIVDITISYHYANEDIIDLDQAIIDLL